MLPRRGLVLIAGNIAPMRVIASSIAPQPFFHNSTSMELVCQPATVPPYMLKAKATAEDLTVEQWLQKLAETDTKSQRDTRTGADLIAALQSSPCRDIEIEPERYRLPVRGVSL